MDLIDKEKNEKIEGYKYKCPYDFAHYNSQGMGNS
jgi:hypothetical protein